MALCSMKELLSAAEKNGCAVGAFSVSSNEMICGVIAAAEERKTPVILQVAECRLKTVPLHVIGAAMLAAAKRAAVPVAVHLDHGLTRVCIREALEMGFTSVMFDGSALPMEENIRITREVCEEAALFGAAVEGEVGSIGRTESGGECAARCARPEDALRFLAATHADALAVAIGNAHGVYQGTPQLRFDILESIRERSAAPLVLHGGTGISDADFHHCIRLGIRKINIATANFHAAAEAAQGAKDYFEMSAKMLDAARAVAGRHMDIFGVSNAVKE